MSDITPLKTSPGVLTSAGQVPIYVGALFSNGDGSEVQALTPDGIETFKVARIDPDPNSDRLVLVTKKIRYTWRPIREADGIWATPFHVPMPTEAIVEILTGDPMGEKLISAYSSGESPYVLGVTYESPEGSWVRTGGSFLPMSPDDTTYADMDRIEIAPEKVKDFLDLYDKNYVTVSDAANFESDSE